MEIFRKISDMQAWSNRQRMAGETIAVVPTMGFLHEGHLSLIDTARANGATKVVVTIFVNPTQFGPNEDFDAYPRDFDHDAGLCLGKNVDAVFAPQPSDMYPADSSTWVTETKLSQGLCGKTRPIHFRGVCTVVTKLFNAVLPHLAVFGQKDGQQARIIKRMVRDLNVPVKIVISPLIREADGLAKSSRNKYLSADERKRALALSHSLFALKAAAEKGERDLAKLLGDVRKEIESAGGVIDYVEAVDSETLEPVTELKGEVMFPVAAKFGNTRLIDNVLVQF